MSELTNERLEEIASGQNTVSIPEAVELARELLALRTLRDAGDEEVLHQRAVVCNGIWSKDKRDHEEADKAIDSIVSTVVSLRQQLREAREEIERFKEVDETMEEIDADIRAAFRTEEIQSLQSQITTLTAERDEAEKKGREAGVAGIMQAMNAQCLTINQLEKQIAAIKSCPAMAEVDALWQRYLHTDAGTEEDQAITEDIADLARRSISSREEVVWLLKEAAGYSDGRLESRAENGDPVAIRILKIVEGK